MTGAMKPSDGRPPTLIRVLFWIGPFWIRMALSVLLGVLTVGSSIGLIGVSAWLISKAALQPSIAELGVSVVAVRFFGISRGVFRYLERLVSHDITFRLLAEIRVRFYQAIEPLAPALFLRYRSGDLLNRMLSDIDILQNTFLRTISPFLVALVIVLLTFALLLAFHSLIALVACGFMVLAVIALPLIAWWNGKHHNAKLVAARAALSQSLVESLHGLSECLAYGQAELQAATLSTLSEQVVECERTEAWLDSLQHGLAILLVNAAALAALWGAIGRIDGIFLATVTLVVVAAFEALSPLGLAAVHLGADATAARRLFEVIDTSPNVTDPPFPAPLPASFSLAFDDVSFRYADGEPLVLDHFSLEIPHGTRIAILGESGSGKSTLVNLLLRFWDYQDGRIILGGQDYRTLSQTDIRQAFGVMTQRTHLFNTTILENIRLGRSEASDEEVIDAAHKAQLHNFIMNLPRQYDTFVGEFGAKLSGGEAQRIALARVLLKNAPIYLLDEATANLDVTTERVLFQTIFEVTAGKTLILLTHRRALLNRMDQVVTLRSP